jgi:hypothetical protein
MTILIPNGMDKSGVGVKGRGVRVGTRVGDGVSVTVGDGVSVGEDAAVGGACGVAIAGSGWLAPQPVRMTTIIENSTTREGRYVLVISLPNSATRHIRDVQLATQPEKLASVIQPLF